MNYYNYFTEIEEHFVKRRGKHLLISPMDWGLIAAWRDAGIPLHVAIRGIDIAMDGFFARQHRGNAKVNSLCYCHDAVMAEFAAHAEARVGESLPDTQNASGDSESAPAGNEKANIEEIAGFVGERIREIKELLAKQYPERALSARALSASVRSASASASSESEGLQRVLGRLEEVLQIRDAERIDLEALERDLTLIDDLLVAELRALVSPEEALEWEQEAKKELKVYKKRLPKETYDKIRENFLRDRIHRKFNIGEFSLVRL